MAPGSIIPLDHTSETHTLISTVDQAGSQIGSINIAQIKKALNVTSADLESVPPATTSALLSGLAQLSNVIGSRSGELAQLVHNVSQLSATLSANGATLFTLLGQSNLVLGVLNQRQATIDQLLRTTASLTTQLNSLLAGHQAQLTPLLTDLTTVSGVLAKDGNDLASAIPLLSAANRYLSNVTGSGAFGDFVLPAGLIPDNVIAACTKPGATNPVTGCAG
jgi:phospholipid/cholesterol/gamma-HCH transport system substrate-binding protein